MGKVMGKVISQKENTKQEEIELLLQKMYKEREKRAKEIYHNILYVNPPVPKDSERKGYWSRRNIRKYV